MLEGIAPEGEIEGMLAAQMVATHSAAMECLKRAMLENQTFEGRDQNLKPINPYLVRIIFFCKIQKYWTNIYS